MSDSTHVLYIGNSRDEKQQLEELLREALGDGMLMTWIDNFTEALWPLDACYYDLVFLDYHLDGRDTIDLLRSATSLEERNMQVIMLAETEDHLDDLEVIRQGAADYLSKQEMSVSMLKRSVRSAIERKKIEQRLLTLSHYDPLTGLANRNLFYLKLTDGTIQSLRGNKLLALFFLDLDHFKEINDPLGHPAGDRLLQDVSTRLKVTTRASDTVARLGGDEFAIIATHPELIEKSWESCKEKGFHPHLIELEITENTLMETGPDAIERLTKLHDMVIKLAIDDFGTGYSSLSYLKKFPVHKLIIDRLFIKDITTDKDDATIARSIIHLGQAMNLEVIAEGVETEEQLNFLRKEGCDQVQGFFFAKPMTNEALIEWLPQRQVKMKQGDC